jgi:hypothetical protein
MADDDDIAYRDTLEADWATCDEDRCERTEQTEGVLLGSVVTFRCALKLGHMGKCQFGAAPYEWK